MKKASYDNLDGGIDGLMEEGIDRAETEDCPLCELFLAEAESGKLSKKDAELFSGHIDADEHEEPMRMAPDKSGIS
jgi:hypothetical protein